MSRDDTLPALPIQDGVEFRFISNFPGYCVSDDGNIWSCWRRAHRDIKAFGNKWRRLPGQPMQSGHLKVSLSGLSGKRHHPYIHRLVLEAFVGPRPLGMQCCHNDGNATNNRASNLRWDTPKANTADSLRHGTFPRGSRAARSKLNEEEVREIRRRLVAGDSRKTLAIRYHVSSVQIHMIAHRKTWAWLDP